MLKDKHIIVGVTGGIAAYKVVDVVSRLKKLNANVEVIMTKKCYKICNSLDLPDFIIESSICRFV